VRTLKPGGAHSEGGLTRNLLTGLQFAVLVVLMVAAIVVFQQRAYATSEGLRVNIDQMLMVRRSCEPAFRAELRKLPGVAGVSCTGSSFLANTQSTTIPWKGADLAVDSVRVDPGIFALYGIKPLAGSLPTDSAQGDYDEGAAHVLIFNQTAIRKLGFASPQAAIGQIVPRRGQGNGPPVRIVAVVPDFAFTSVEKELQATMYDPGPPMRTGGDLVSIKLKGEAIPETLAAIDRLWVTTTGNEHPISRFFLADHMQEQYVSMVRQAQMLAVFAGLAILIACMGLFGLSLSTTERRIKEIGVRKVMGADNGQIVTLLLWQFGKPVLWANLVAWPVAWWLMQHWLSGFAYHVELQWWVFAAASAGALLVALLTVAGQAWLTARAKPVLALRCE
jgi:putative ABC transport system permease protein